MNALELNKSTRTAPDLSDAGGEPGTSSLHCTREGLPILQELLLLLGDAGPVVGEEGEVDHVRVDLHYLIHHYLRGRGRRGKDVAADHCMNQMMGK